MQYRFGRHTLDLDAVELRCDGDPVDLEPRSFAVLCHLVEQRHRVVPKTELLDEIWGDRFVSESALTTRIKDCRRALGDDGTTQRYIKTVHRIGYRFVGDASPAERPEPDRDPAPRPVAVSPAWATGTRAALVGRADELIELADRLASSRVVTITGPGGVGKSSLASAYADQAALPDGALWVCDLTTTRDPGTVAEVVLAALGERPQSDADPLATINRVAQVRRGLVVLDNCEHLLDAVRPVVDELTVAGSGLRVLATSRLSIDLAQESVLVLEPLAIDAAVACLVARATDSGAELDPTDPAVAELCERLDRIPLALELAASRARLLGPRQMIELLDDRFRLLRRTGGDEHSSPHRSLDATIAWSWDLLDPADQHLLAELSVFVGSFSLDDAAGVTTPDGDVLDVLDGLDRLVRASMVVAVAAPDGGRRFRLLDAIRDFGAAHLDPAAARSVHQRHGEYCAALVEHHDAQLLTDSVDDPLDALATAWPNVRAAVDHVTTAGDLTTARRIIRAVGAYADLYQAFEVIDWCERARLTERSGDTEVLAADDPDLVADAVAIWARLLAHRGEHDRAAELAALAHATRPSFVTQLSVVWAAYYRGQLDEVVTGAERLVDSSRSEHGVDRAYADGFRAIVTAVRQEPVLESTEVTPADADDGLLGTLRCLTAGFRLCAADPDRAASLLEAVVAASLRRDYRLLLGAAASTLTQITLPGRPPDEAMRTLCRTLERYLERGMWPLISADTVMAASLLADAGDHATACRLLGARNSSGYRVGMSETTRAVLEDRLRATVGDRFEALVAEGAAWSPPYAGEVAVAAMHRHLDGS